MGASSLYKNNPMTMAISPADARWVFWPVSLKLSAAFFVADAAAGDVVDAGVVAAEVAKVLEVAAVGADPDGVLEVVLVEFMQFGTTLFGAWAASCAKALMFLDELLAGLRARQ